MTRVVKCIKPTQGLEVGKLYEVVCDNYDLIYLGGEHDGHSRDRFEYVRALHHPREGKWCEIISGGQGTCVTLKSGCSEIFLNHCEGYELSELPTETPEPHPLTKYTRKSNVGTIENDGVLGEPLHMSSIRQGVEADKIVKKYRNTSLKGVKHDDGKLKPSLLLDDMPLAIQEMLKVLKYGADKYAEGNWLKVDDGENRYRNACDRHRLQSSIEEYDTESGLLHLAHEAVNAVMLLELVLRGKQSVTVGIDCSKCGTTLTPCGDGVYLCTTCL